VKGHMSAEKIIAKIQKDAEHESKQIKKDAEKGAAEIIKEATKEAEEQAKHILMNERETIIEECFTKAHHKLSILPEQKHRDIVKRLLKDGKKKLGTKCHVFVSRSYLKEMVKDSGLVVKGMVETSGGIIVTSADNKITLDYTFDSILKREKDKIRIRVGKLLFST
jgi:vacuolar-type H+-ATPase subunit E/Vma4